MSAEGVWAIIAAVAAGSYLLRLSFIQAWQWIRVPVEVQRALRYVPPAVFAALILPALVAPAGAIDLSPDNLRLVAGALAGVVAWYSGNVLLTLVAGMGSLWLLEALL